MTLLLYVMLCVILCGGVADDEGEGAEGGDTAGYHVFGWRDWFDIAIRWRQYCEPMDVVYWLDRLDLPDDQVGRQTDRQTGWQQAAGSRQQAAGSRQQAAGSRQQAAGSRQQAASSRQQAGRERHRDSCGPLQAPISRPLWTVLMCFWLFCPLSIIIIGSGRL